VGLVLHGPTIIDTGWAERLLDALERLGEVRAKLGGTTGYIALLDAGLQDRVEFDRKLPSECLEELREWADALVLANHGKSRESGLAFAEGVLARAEGVDSLVQVERPGEPDGGIVLWSPGESERRVARHLSDELGLEVIEVREAPEGAESSRRRRISCVKPGDRILVNGVTVGVAESDDVVLVFDEEGRLVDIEGGRLKREGVERLGRVDPARAVVKTDRRLRRREPDSRRVTPPPDRVSRAVLVDHDAERRVEDIRWADAVVAVGDDTTAVCAELGDRLGSWVVGIVDLDPDGWVVDDTREALERSENLICLLVCRRDDDAGEVIRGRLFSDGHRLELDEPERPEEWVERLVSLLEEAGVLERVLRAPRRELGSSR